MTLEEIQDRLRNADISKHVEKKQETGMSYLSWAWAWDEVLKVDPTANYEILYFDGLPYQATPLGIMCSTKVTIGGVTRFMWLPVMDHRFRALKSEPYKDSRGYTVQAADMFDINKTIMRCLVKNLAMFGLGITVYAGEDLPQDEPETPKRTEPTKKDDKPVREDQGFTLNQASATVTEVKTLADEVKGLADQLTEEASVNFYAFVGKAYGGRDLYHLEDKALLTLKDQLERKLNKKGGE